MADKSNPSTEEPDRQSAPTGASPDGGAASGKPSAEKKDLAGSSSSGRSTGKASEHVSLKSMSSLERLRDRVENVAHELKRLREENQALSERIKELEARPNVDPQGTFLSLEHEPELLRRKISGFIEAIDRYLETERKRS